MSACSPVVPASEYLSFAFSCQQAPVKERDNFSTWGFFFPILYKFQKSIFFFCTLVIFAHGTAAGETEDVWLIWGQILCRQLQSKLPHPALPLTWTLTCWDHPLAPATTWSIFLLSEHRQLAKMPKYLCVKTYTCTVSLCDFFCWTITKTTKRIWQSGIYWQTRSLSAYTLSLWASYIFDWGSGLREKENTERATTTLQPHASTERLLSLSLNV